MRDDGYKVDGMDGQSVSDGEATGFLVTNGDATNIFHIGIKNDDDTWSADQGIYKPTENVTKADALGKGAANSFVKIRNVSKADRNKGKATGVKIVDQAQIKKILEQLKLYGAKKVLDGIDYEN